MDEDFKIIEIVSFEEIIKLKEGFKNNNNLGVDIRNMVNQNERRRLMDFITGVAFGRDLKIRVINKEGVYLIYEDVG
jgi:FtsZ-interacting cell division protein YlmF